MQMTSSHPTLEVPTRRSCLVSLRAFWLVVGVLMAAATPRTAIGQDVNAPYVAAFQPKATPAVINTGRGNGFLEIKALLGDSGVGVNYLEAILHPRHEDGSVDFSQSIVGKWQLGSTLVGGTLNNGEFSLILRIPKGTPTNTFHLHSLAVYDAAGNHTKYFSDPQAGENALPSAVAVTVATTNAGVTTTTPSASQDSLPPAIAGVQFWPDSVEVAANQAFVNVEVQATDDFSGVSKVDAWFMAPDGSQVSMGGNVEAAESILEGGVHHGRFFLRVAVPAGATPGAWTLSGVLISDASGKTTLQSHPNKVLTVTNNGATNLALKVPVGISVAAEGGDAVRISWSDSNAGLASYKLRMVTASGGAWTVVGTTAPGATSFLASGITKPLLTWFQVQAFNSKGASAWSSPVSASSASGSFWSDAYGQLTYANGGNNADWAWSESLQTWLAFAGDKMHSADYGWLTPGSTPGWVNSSKLGWLRIHSHGGESRPSDAAWVWSSSFGWVISNFDGSGQFFYSRALGGWLAVTSNGNIWSYDYGWVTPGADAGWVNSSLFGWLRIYGHGAKTPPSNASWVWSNNLGWIVSHRTSSGQFFYSHSLKGWLAVSSSGSIWSYDYGWLTPGSNAGWFNSSALGWIYIGEFDGWVWSARAGWLVSSRSGSPSFFWSNAYGWLAADGAGGLWSYSRNNWL